MAAVDNAVSPHRTAPAIQRPKLEELLTKKVYAKTSIIPAYSACWLLPSSSSPLLPLFFRLQFPLFVYLFLTPLSLRPHLTFWLPFFYLSWFPFVFHCGVWTPKEVLVNIRLVGLFVGWMCVQVCWGNVLWFKLAYIKAIVNSDVIHVSSPHPQCLFFPVALNKLLHFPVDCYSLAVHSHSKYNPVLLLPCWFPLPLQLPSTPLHYRSNLMWLLMTLPMLQPCCCCCCFSGTISLRGHIHLIPCVHQLLSSKSVLHGSHHRYRVLKLACLCSARCCRCP